MSRTAGPIVAALVGLLFAAALAQPSVEPTAYIAIEGLEPGPFKLAPGDERASSFDVRLAVSGLACPAGVDLVVTLRTEIRLDEGAEVEPSVEPPALTFSVPPGAYAPDTPSPEVNATQAATLGIRALPGTEAKIEPAIAIVAEFAGGMPEACVSSGPLPAASAEAVQTVFITPREEPGTGGGGSGPPANGESPPPTEEPTAEEEDGVPAPPASLVALAAVLAVLTRRRA